MKRLIYILLLAIATVSCNTDDNFAISENKKDCKVSFSIAEVVLTRANIPIEENTLIDIYAYEIIGDTEATTETDKITYKVNVDGKLFPETAGNAMYLTLGKTYNFYAVTPQQTITNKTFDLNNSYEDYLKIASTGNTRLTDKEQSLQLANFNQFCSSILFNFKIKGEQQIIKSFEINGNGIKVENLTVTPITFSLNDLTINYTGLEQTGSFTIPHTAVTQQGTDQIYDGIMYIMPKEEAPINFTFDFQVNGFAENNATFMATTPAIAFEPHKKYVFSIEITDPKITLKIGLVDWNTTELTEDNIGGTLNYFYACDWTISAINWSTEVGDTADFPVTGPIWGAKSWSTNEGDVAGFPVNPPGAWYTPYTWETTIGEGELPTP